MAKIFTLICPACEKEFRHLQHPSDAPVAPRYCPICGHDSESETINIPIPFKRAITAPHVAKSIGKVADQTYRMMEETALDRISQAAEMTGLPESDFADMKITDLQDNLRDGDIAAKPLPANPVTQRMDEMKSAGMVVGNVGAEQGAAFAQATTTGVAPYAGARTANVAREHFRNMGPQIMRASETGRF